MPDWLLKYIGGGALIVVTYVIISNVLWLLLGARALQYLPGVNDKSAKGTLKLLLFLLCVLWGLFLWLLHLFPVILQISQFRNPKHFIGKCIQFISRVLFSLFNRR